MLLESTAPPDGQQQQQQQQQSSPVDVILGIRKKLAEFQRANSADDSGGGDGGNARALRAALRAACLAALRGQLENPAPDAGTGVGSAGVGPRCYSTSATDHKSGNSG